MTNEQKSVREFHRTFGATVNDEPTTPSALDGMLRFKLMYEELGEFVSAMEERDVDAVADALGDLLYVLLGTAVTYGIDLEPVFAEIHRSNMSKLWTVAECSVRSPDGMEAKQVVNWTSPDERAYVMKRADGKVIKSPSYSPANLAPILDAQMKDK